ncbi:MAG TPA: DUF4157 domain-containing protein, partial [Aggregatilineales bacterium]|nr:DUF4157 domain-containing protein [Aggregatilineales bacterium]
MSGPKAVQTVHHVQPAPPSAGVLQRQCACGNHTNDGECEECRRKREEQERNPSLQRAVTSPDTIDRVPPIVYDVLRSSGQRLDPDARAFLEPRFGHDFSNVRVHTDARAAESARSVNARAYTVGRDVVFEAGQYRPDAAAGRELLAHELTHVVQQNGKSQLPSDGLAIDDPGSSAERQASGLSHENVSGATAREGTQAEKGDRPHQVRPRRGLFIEAYPRLNRSPILQRSRGTFWSAIGGFFSSIFHGIFGFSDKKLQEYLDDLFKTGDIEGDPDSDDKARAIVRKWMVDRTAFDLKPRHKRLLILEMLDGPTTKGDEDAILDLLETSRGEDLTEIFGASGVFPKKLQDDLDDKESQPR